MAFLECLSLSSLLVLLGFVTLGAHAVRVEIRMRRERRGWLPYEPLPGQLVNRLEPRQYWVGLFRGPHELALAGYQRAGLDLTDWPGGHRPSIDFEEAKSTWGDLRRVTSVRFFHDSQGGAAVADLQLRWDSDWFLVDGDNVHLELTEAIDRLLAQGRGRGNPVG